MSESAQRRSLWYNSQPWRYLSKMKQQMSTAVTAVPGVQHSHQPRYSPHQEGRQQLLLGGPITCTSRGDLPTCTCPQLLPVPCRLKTSQACMRSLLPDRSASSSAPLCCITEAATGGQHPHDDVHEQQHPASDACDALAAPGPQSTPVAACAGRLSRLAVQTAARVRNACSTTCNAGRPQRWDLS